MKEEKVIVDESLVLKFEDSTQPAKRIKREPTDPEESKVFVDATTQTEVFDADLKVEIGTQTDGQSSIFAYCAVEKGSGAPNNL